MSEDSKNNHHFSFPECPRDAPLAAIIGGTVAAVVLIPLLIICLIIIIRNRRDAKEYADFLNEKDKARWESVCYKDFFHFM